MAYQLTGSTWLQIYRNQLEVTMVQIPANYTRDVGLPVTCVSLIQTICDSQ